VRPQVLVMQAFGPYAGRQVLDFSELHGYGFFLIHGPTGAGKTTILDAMCFALYGTTTGAEREARDMRSDHADPALLTEVRFDFTVGDKSYRIERRPEQTRPKKTGDGMTSDQPKATLWDRTGAAADDEGKPLATKTGEVTTLVEQILGFRSVQFRQVVMLPQGQFQRLLQAKSSDREEILQRLFRSDRFRQIQDTLKERALAIGREVGESTTRKQLILEQAGVESADELGDRVDQLGEQIAEGQAELAAAEAAEQGAYAALKGAEAVDKKIAELTDAQGVRAALEAQAAVVAAQGEELSLGRRAATLEGAEALLRERAKTVDEGAGAIAVRNDAFERAAHDHAAADKRLTAESGRKGERTRLDDTVRDLAQLQAKAGPLGAADQALAAADEALAAADRRRDEAADAAAATAATAEKLQSEIAEIQRAGESLAGAERLAAEAGQRLVVRGDLERALSGHKTLKGDLARQETAATKARKRFDVAVHELEAAERAWESGRAAVLARTLAPGVACPVCGSTEHPQPAESAEMPPTDESVAALRASVVDLRDAFDKARESANEGRTAERGLAYEIDTAGKALGQHAEWPLERCRTEQAEAQAGFARLKLQVGAADGAIEAQKTAVAAAEAARRALANAQIAAGQARAARDKSKGTVDERAAGIPDQYRDPAALAHALASATEARDTALAALESTRSVERTALERLTAAKEAARQAEASLASSRKELKKAAAGFARRRTQAGFSDDPAYEAARRSPAKLEALDKAVADHAQAVAAAEGLLKRALAAAKGLERPDVEALRRDHEAKKAVADTGRGVKAGHEADLKSALRAVDDLARLDEHIGARAADYAVAGRLSEVANGVSPSNPRRLSLQRYMLGAYFDDVLVVASQRLDRMTEGRYLLRRVASGRDGRSAAGLDLEVFDAFTGRERPVSTLSGGETFQASLALALGLADVVQAYEGGIRLDTVFVDEGFGSLDPENLDAAIDTLMGLQTGGRLVGIISHVGELRRQIDARLEIEAGKAGSTARFIIP